MRSILRFWYLPVIAILLFGNIKACKSYFEIAKRISKYDKDDASIKKQIQTSATIISRKIDKFGLNHVTIAEGENVLPRELINDVAVSPGILDTTAMALDILKKQIQSITVINSTLEAKNLRAEKHLDSLKREIYIYNDRFVSLKFKPADTINKEATFDFKYDAKLNYVQYWKKKFPIIGAKRSYIDIWSDDPRTSINGVNRLKIEEREPQFGLRIQMRSIYSLTSQKLFVGPGVSFDFKRYNILGYSYYNVTDNRWIKAVGINYDLIRF